jgi:hypothetical protein
MERRNLMAGFYPNAGATARKSPSHISALANAGGF